MISCRTCEGIFLIGDGKGGVLPFCPRCHRSPSGGIDLQAAVADLQASVAAVHLDLGMHVPDAIVCPTRAAVEDLRPSPVIKRGTAAHVRDCYRRAGSRRFREGGAQ